MLAGFQIQGAYGALLPKFIQKSGEMTYTVSQKKHVTTYSTITFAIGVQLQ